MTSEKETDVDFERIARELIVALRGRQSTTRLSQRLGFRYDQVSRWEKGDKVFFWKDFCKLCETLKVPLRKQLQFNYIYSHENFHDGSELMNALKGDKSISDFAKNLSRKRLVVSRWLSGETELPLAEFLHALYIVHNNADELLDGIVSIGQLPYAASLLEARLKERRLIVKYPWISVLVGALNLEDCPPHPDTAGFINARFGIKVSTVKKVLSDLQSLGILELDSEGFFKHKRTFRVGPLKSDSRIIKKYWLRLAQKSLEQPEEMSGFFLLAVSDQGWAKVVQRYRQFFTELVEIVNDPASGPPLKHFRVVNVQLLDLLKLGTELEADGR